MKLKNFITSIQRYLKSLKRPSKKTNLQKLHERGETVDSFTFRDATEEDLYSSHRATLGYDGYLRGITLSGYLWEPDKWMKEQTNFPTNKKKKWCW